MDPCAEESQTEQAINRAVLLDRQGRLDEAEEATRSFLLLNPTSARGYEVLGAILGQKGDADASLEALDTAVRLDPGDLVVARTFHNAEPIGHVDGVLGAIVLDIGDFGHVRTGSCLECLSMRT